MTSSVAFPVVTDGPLAVGAAGDDGHRSGFAERASERVGIIAFIGHKIPGAAHAGEQFGRDLYIGHVAGRQEERIRAADDIGERVDLCGPATARAADPLRFSPLLPPNAARWALT